MMRYAGPAVVDLGSAPWQVTALSFQARSRRLASPFLSSSSIAPAPLHVMWTSVHRLVLRLFRAESVSNNAIAVSVAHLRPYKKPPSRLWTRATRRIVVPPLFALQRASAGPPRYTANRPSRANGRIPGTATEDSPSGSGVSCGRIAAALSALAFRLRVSPREPLSVAPRALAQSPSQPVDSMQCARSIAHVRRFRWRDRLRAAPASCAEPALGSSAAPLLEARIPCPCGCASTSSGYCSGWLLRHCRQNAVARPG